MVLLFRSSRPSPWSCGMLSYDPMEAMFPYRKRHCPSLWTKDYLDAAPVVFKILEHAPVKRSRPAEEDTTLRLALDVGGCSPEHLKVDVDAATRVLTVTGRTDGANGIQMSFEKAYQLPEDCDLDSAKSKLSAEGVLTFTALRAEKKSTKREIAVEMETTPAPEGEVSSEDKTEEPAQQEQEHSPSDESVQTISIEVEEHPDEVATVDEPAAEATAVEEEKPFALSMDVSGFEPGEVKVEVSDDGVLSVSGFHEERSSASGLPHISRQFKKFYALPKKHQGDVSAEVSKDGVLKISVARTQSKEIEVKTQPQQTVEKAAKE